MPATKLRTVVMKNNFKNILDVRAQCAHSADMAGDTKRINRPTNLTLRPVIRKAAKKYCRETGESLSGLANALLKGYFESNGYLPKEALTETIVRGHAPKTRRVE
jgi:hypothetical protein